MAPDGRMYQQIDGVSMGSPLGPLLSNFYMGDLEHNILQNTNNKPNIYARYVDDIFIVIENETKLIDLKNEFISKSVLNFTHENSINSKLPFLDIMLDHTNNKFSTSVYHKTTDKGACLNANSECPEKYKTSVITNYINRAYKVSSSWDDFHTEIERVKQTLVNNNFSIKNIDEILYNILNKKFNVNEDNNNKQFIQIYYRNQMNKKYKTDERILKNILDKNTKCIDPDKKLQLIIYYKNIKTKNFVIKNNCNPQQTLLDKANAVYCFSCPLPHGQVAEQYIGMTQCQVRKRLIQHTNSGSIFEHFKQHHNLKPTREQLFNNTIILDQAENRFKLSIKEALHILNKNPTINRQYNTFPNILKLHIQRNIPTQSFLRNTPSQQALNDSPPQQPSRQYPVTPSQSPHNAQVNNTSSDSNAPSIYSISNNNNSHIHNINLVSPIINSRINSLVNNSTVINTNTQYSPMRLRSQRQLHLP